MKWLAKQNKHMAIVLTLESAKQAAQGAVKVGVAAAAFVLCTLASVAALAADPTSTPVAALTAASGAVVHVSGTLSVQRPDGAILVLGQKSEVYPGDLLSTQKDSYAQVNFTDGSSLTLRPNTQLKVESYNYVQDRPQEDSAFFRLVKGGLRTVTGLVGKRGNQDALRIGTPTATIGVRGSVGDTMACAPSCDGVVKGGDTLQPGTHHQTHSGSFVMQTGDKTEIVQEGHSGYSNGVDIKVTIGGIGGGKIDLYLPTGGGLKAAGCK